MKKLLLLSLLFIPVLLSAQQQSPQPVIRAKLLPTNKIIVGQPIRLVVEVLAPNYFTGAPDFPPFELDGAIVTLSDDRPEHFNEQQGSSAFAGIRRFYLIYPEQAGRFTIPALAISIPYASKPPESTDASVVLPPLGFTAALPPEAQGLDYFLPTTQLTIQQQWSAPLTNVHVGDAVSRTVVITAQKMQAMLIPPLPLTAPEGIRVYPKSPDVESKKSPIGEFLAGVRTECVSYVFTKAGDYLLPEVKLTWWNLSTRKLVTSTLPTTTIHVVTEEGYISELPPAAPQTIRTPISTRSGRSYRSLLVSAAIGSILFAVIIFTVYKCGSGVRDHIKAIRSQWLDSEPAHWHRLKQALKRNDRLQSYILLLAWVRRSGRWTDLEDFRLDAEDQTLDDAILLLTRSLFTSNHSGPWNGRALVTALDRHRQGAKRATPSTERLPALNPFTPRD